MLDYTKKSGYPSYTLKRTRGYVVDGHARDADFLMALDFPVYCELTMPADIAECWTYDRLGEPSTIGTVTTSSGDYLIGDSDGVVVIPRVLVEQVVTQTEQVMATEGDMRKAILDGMDPDKHI